MTTKAVRGPETGVRRVKWAPSTVTGWLAVATGTAAVVFALIFPALMTPLSGRLHDTPFRWLSGGREMLMGALLLGFIAAALAIRAILGLKDRALLLWVVLVPSALMTVFWLVFAIGEVVSTH